LESPALQIDYLKRNYNLAIFDFQLSEVVRQTVDSGILFNATLLRKKIAKSNFIPPLFKLNSFDDFIRINGNDLEEELQRAYSKYLTEEVVIITRSNKRANIFNNEIRNRIFFRENRICTGDFLMVVKNNYYWIDETSEVGFLANGDMMEILGITNIKELYGFHFADVRVRLCDYPAYPPVEIKIILESLESEAASLSSEKMKALYEEIAQDYADIANKRTRYLKIKDNPYLNAVQVKFSYSLTCHKTQGGQWKITFIDLNYFDESQMSKEMFRWLYTALTRTTKKVYLLNFPEFFF